MPKKKTVPKKKASKSLNTRPKKTVTKKSTPTKKVVKKVAKKTGKPKPQPVAKVPQRLKITKNGIESIAVTETKVPRFDSKKYVRILETESSDKFKELGERVQRKELKWILYAVENNVGVHYYVILNVNK